MFRKRNYCRQYQVQLLDQAGALQQLTLRRNSRGNLRLLHAYSFEFTSTGDERYIGTVIYLGQQLQAVDLGTYIVPNASAQAFSGADADHEQNHELH